MQTISDQFELRNIRPEETDKAVEIEHICFPPHEACSKKSMTERIRAAADLFLVAIDKESGEIAGFLNGIAVSEYAFRDEFFTDISLHDARGKCVMLVGLDVLPEYRGRGLATLIMRTYKQREAKRGREKLYLTCLPDKVCMYEKMGYKDNGIANSTWGNEEWHEMEYVLSEKDL